MRWEQAWHEALYGPDGFYRRHAPAEHFATSTQGVPGAGEVLAAAVVALARGHGCTQVVDVGAGGGELLAHVAALAPDLQLTGVDVVDRRPPGVHRWLLSPGGAELPEELVHLTDALVVAHEWLDVVPCPVVERDEHGVWREVTVLPDGTESSRRVSSSGAASSDRDAEILHWLGRWVPGHVVRAEVGPPRDRAAADLLGRIDRGVLLVVDYGHTREDRPVHGTLTGFRSGREVLPVPDGTCDLTAHVAVDSLVDHLADAFPGTTCEGSSQAEALTRLLPAAGAQVPHELALSAPTAYLEALARRGALATLRAPDGPGGFHWLVLRRQ
ncbi:SAM-dependent methyltransferase [Ornithinimicrobium avium]|uniref:SAM-dependent methyltransferase n=1 Tax=Ornithinimicrobium avium TaxID=2283195 RepID=A0A345NQ64_9MICO|nr:SAM-dependent methyltransferase [Ornithinimicrobium avium]AXH97172.1 hypothetical protein DV701_14555 [Ornithinimicrobium avium]